MNITEALNVALPEIPARTVVQRYPRMDPNCTFREHIDDGERVMRVYVPSEQSMYKFPLRNWALIQLFDGTRSYEEIAALNLEKSVLNIGRLKRARRGNRWPAAAPTVPPTR